MRKKNIVILVIVLIIIISVGGYFLIKKNKEENRKYEIETISKYNYFVVKENNQYGVIDRQGNKIVETKYDDVKIPNPEKNVFICYEDKNTKVFNDNGEEIFTQYENIEPLRLKNISSDLMYEKSVLKYSKNGKYGIVDFSGKKITDAIYEEVDTLQFKEGELLVKNKGKYGVINIKGTTLVNLNYDKIESDKFYEEGNGYKKSGYIVSNTTDEGYRYGYVSLEGKKLVDTKYNDLQRITNVDSNDVYIICADNGKYGLLKNNKKMIDNEYQSLAYAESNNTLIALRGKKYGVISITGEIIVPFEYKQIDITGDYIYAMLTEENTKVFNSKGQETNIDKDLAILNVDDTDYKIYIQTMNEKTLYSIYKNQQKITENEYTYIQYLYDNYFIACDTNGKLGIIDDNENINVEFVYNAIQKIENTKMVQALNNSVKTTEIYSEKMKKICELKNAVIQNNIEYLRLYNEEESKYILKDGKEIKITELFTKNNIFARKLGSKWGFVDINGNKVVNYEYEDVTEINEYGFAGIKQDGKWGVVNNKGKVICEPVYELNDSEPTFIGQYYQVIYGNGEIYYTK